MKLKTIAERLVALRTEYNLSTEKLARLVKMSRVTIDNVEKGKSVPYKSNIEAIAKKLGSTYEWLGEGKGDMLPNGRIELVHSDTSNVIAESWHDEAWAIAKDQLAKKDIIIDRLTQALLGGKNSFPQALNQTGLHKKRRLGAAA